MEENQKLQPVVETERVKPPEETLKMTKGVFISVFSILIALIVVAGVLTLVLPMGEFARAGKEIIPGTYTRLEGADRLPVWRWLTAPVEIFGSSDALTVLSLAAFIVILGGAFNVIEGTGGIQVIVNRLIKKFEKSRYAFICILTLFFMLLGALFGIYEEALVLLPLILLIAAKFKWDNMVGMALCLVSLAFGFATGITNPFTIGLIASMAGFSVLEAIWYRIIIFITLYALVCGFHIFCAKRAEKKNAAKGSEEDITLLKELTPEEKKVEDKLFTTYVIFFISVLAVLVLSSAIPVLQSLAMYLIGGSFLIGSLIAGYVVSSDMKKVGKLFGKGALALAPAVPILILAACVKFIMQEGMVMDTVLNSFANLLSGMPMHWAVLLLFLIVLVVEFFITSASAKIMLMIPLLVPVCTAVGIPLPIMAMAFMFTDGFSNVFFPTNPVMLIGLGISKVSYFDWVKRTGLLQLTALVISCGFLMLATVIL